MRIGVSPTRRIAAGLLVVASLSAVGYHVFRRRDRHSPEVLLKRADQMSWLNNWIGAAPLYHQAEIQFLKKREFSKALYVQVSMMPAESESSVTIPNQIAILRHDLALPAAQNPRTELRILTILGMLETNYDAGMARSTWAKVESLAIRQHHLLLASRAVGEQGIAAFLIGDIETAKKDVLRAWLVAKIADPAAHVRYASVYGTALVNLHEYKQALGPLNEAIRVAKNTPGIAYPSIAITAKIEALSGLGRNRAALTLANEELREVSRYHLVGHLYSLYQTRARVEENAGQWNQAISDLTRSTQYAQQLSYWRGITQADGLLAEAYLHEGQIYPALHAIDTAIYANEQIPDELYFVPRDLAIKAQILEQLGNISGSNSLYEKSEDLLDALLSQVATPSIERHLINDLKEVYAGYFCSLIHQGRLADAFRTIELARGRIEDQALTDHSIIAPHEPGPAEQRLTRLRMKLLDADDATARAHILHAIYSVERKINPEATNDDAPPSPVPLSRLQRDLHPSELFIEYVLATPHSYALAVTRNTVRCYALSSRSTLEQDAALYRSQIIQQKASISLGQYLFDELLKPIRAYGQKKTLIIVEDGELHLLPFAALIDQGQYVLESHQVSVVPSGTVLDMLRHRRKVMMANSRSYLGVAPWISHPPQTTLLAEIRRSFSSANHKDPAALPESRYEVETIASELPRPNTILLGTQASKANFLRLPLDRYSVIDLALHGHVNTEFPDRSALLFSDGTDHSGDSALEVREIRKLPLRADLVTLSACNTGVGPVSEEGVANIENAFLDAGAQSVVATLWAVQDQATAHLMVLLYSGLSHHQNKAEALRQAQLQMLQGGAPPYYWAGFVIDGDPNGNLFAPTHKDVTLRTAG